MTWLTVRIIAHILAIPLGTLAAVWGAFQYDPATGDFLLQGNTEDLADTIRVWLGLGVSAGVSASAIVGRILAKQNGGLT